MGGRDNASEQLRGAAGMPPLQETALGSPADLHATDVVGPGAAPPGGPADPAVATMSVHGDGGKGGRDGRDGRNAAWVRQTGNKVKHGADEAMDAADAVYSRIQRITQAEGAGQSGLAHVIELNAVVATGDLLVTVALATSLFFSLQPNEARPKVALYLLVTMVPFVLLAPVIGPVLDRLRGGRRFAMALTALIRALLALVLAKTIAGGSLAVYPAAFGCLAASRAYGVSRSAVIPRVLPPGTSLVRANSRINLFTLFATLVATPIGYGLGKLGHALPLLLAALVFFAGTWLALRLPKHVDSDEGEMRAQLRREDHGLDENEHTLAQTLPDKRLRSVGTSVLLALRATGALRAYAGFTALYFAFMLRTNSIGGLHNLTAIGLVAGAIAVGGGLGSLVGGWLKARAPEGIVTGCITVSAIVTVLTAFYYNLPMVLLACGLAGLAPSLAKLSLDAMIQRDTVEQVRTSAFAKSETLMQLCWVLGAGLGLVMPSSHPVLAVSTCAVWLSVVTLITAKALTDQRHSSPS
ncbi:MFS transporter [Actinospica robiniae]|uniref:MFS transporter n=1 Tax=Actinospica robiniae TaxID=304901 RepID=UPI0003FC63D1|nr:MFS transporter [Actinospica robiniae]